MGMKKRVQNDFGKTSPGLVASLVTKPSRSTNAEKARSMTPIFGVRSILRCGRVRGKTRRQKTRPGAAHFPTLDWFSEQSFSRQGDLRAKPVQRHFAPHLN